MTSYENIYKRFFRKIKQDVDYFSISGLTENELEEIVNERSLELLDDAVNEIQPLVAINQKVDFLDKNDMFEQFNFELTSVEEDILSDMMYIKYLDEESVRLKTIQKFIGTNSMKVFSPASERNSFMNMVEYKREMILNKMQNYNTRNRITGAFLLPY